MSPIFFGYICTKYKDFDSYYKTLDNLMENKEEYHKHLTQMIYVTGHIAFAKFSNVNKGIKALLRSLLCYIIFLILVFAICKFKDELYFSICLFIIENHKKGSEAKSIEAG